MEQPKKDSDNVKILQAERDQLAAERAEQGTDCKLKGENAGKLCTSEWT